MAAEEKDLGVAQEERQERSRIVEADYEIEHAGGPSWVVMHPTEQERCYAIDMSKPACSCPDFGAYCARRAIWCKHLLAISRMTGIALPQRPKPRLGDNPYLPGEVVRDPGKVRRMGAITTQAQFEADRAAEDPFAA